MECSSAKIKTFCVAPFPLHARAISDFGAMSITRAGIGLSFLFFFSPRGGGALQTLQELPEKADSRKLKMFYSSNRVCVSTHAYVMRFEQRLVYAICAQVI